MDVLWKKNKRCNSHVHEKALRIVYRNNGLCFDEMSKIDKSCNKHHKSLQTLPIELSKVKV